MAGCALKAVMQRRLGDVIQDPAAGTGGFLIAAQHWIREHQDVFELDEAQQKKFYERTFFGMEHVQDTHRLALMNLMLHGLDSRPGLSHPATDDSIADLIRRLRHLSAQQP
jgi:type I restriction enzyme M protein